MLRKLMKYEFKETYKLMFMIYGLLIILSAILSTRIRFNIDIPENRMGTVLDTLNVLIVFAWVLFNGITIISMFVYSIYRFKSNLLGNGGYLMHTLPVKVRDHILSKVFVSIIWTIASFIALGVAYFTLFLLGEFEIEYIDAFRRGFELIKNDLAELFTNPETYLYFTEIIILGLVTLIATYMHIYASMSVGFSLNKYKALASIGVFVIINILSSIIQGIFFNEQVFVFNRYLNYHGILCCMIAYQVITGFIYYFITKYFLTHRLNLQ